MAHGVVTPDNGMCVISTVENICVESHPLDQWSRSILLKFKRWGWSRAGVHYIADAYLVSEDELEHLKKAGSVDNTQAGGLRILSGYAKSQYGASDAKFGFRLAVNLD